MLYKQFLWWRKTSETIKALFPLFKKDTFVLPAGLETDFHRMK